MRFNTGIAAMMEFVNGAYKWEQRPKVALEQFVLLLAPYAPHLAEEMWQVYQHARLLHTKRLHCIEHFPCCIETYVCQSDAHTEQVRT